MRVHGFGMDKIACGAGEKGQIKVIFNAKGFSGKFSKSIFVKSNAKEDVVVLKIEGKVLNKKENR